jgi:hypothetical protein
MNILNNGRFGMVAGLSGTMKMAIRKSIVCISIEKIYEKKKYVFNRISRKIVVNLVVQLMDMVMFKKNLFEWK